MVIPKQNIRQCTLTIFKSCHVLPQVEGTTGEDVVDNLDVDNPTEHRDSTDLSSVLDDQLPVENTLSESVTLLQEVENVLQEDDVPEGQDFAEEVTFEEDLQLHEGNIEKEEYEVEEDQDGKKDLKEEVAEDGEKMDCVEEEVCMEEEDEGTKMENMDEEEKQESEEDAEKEADQEEEMLVEDNKVVKNELNEEDKEEKTKDQSCPLEDEKQETKLDTSITIESFHETDQSVEHSASVSTEVVNQPEDLLAQECTEQPSFVVMASLELSFSKKTSNHPKQTEDVPEILQEDANEQHDILEECEDQSTESLQTDERSEEVHQEEVLSESHQSSTSESETAKESSQEVSRSATDDEPVFNKFPGRDQSSDSMRAELSVSQVETQSLPSSPLQRERCQSDEDSTPENPFGVRLRKTAVLHRYTSEGESPTPNTEPVDTQKSPFLEQLSRKPAFSKKPDQVADGVVKPKRTSGTNCLFSIICTL